MMFRDRIQQEVDAQRALRKRKQPIPTSLRRYARLAGLGIMLVCTAGSILIVVIAYFAGTLYWGVVLFLMAVAAMGFLQLVTGRHLITGR